MQKALFILALVAVSIFATTTRADPTTKLLSGCDKIVCSNEPQLRPNEVINFWTDNRMREAWPAANYDFDLPIKPPLTDPLLPTPDKFGYAPLQEPYEDYSLSRVTGILFFREVENGEEKFRHCSASVIKSVSHSLILTAAHCIKTNIGWRDMLMFVPAYRENDEGDLKIPLERWPIYQAFFPAIYDGNDTVSDIAVARVYSKSAPIGPSITLEQLVGDSLTPQLSSAGDPVSRLRLVGYPAAGSHELECMAKQRQCLSDTDTMTLPTIILLNCALRGGNSGGPLVVTRDGVNTVIGVGVKTNPSAGQARLLRETFLPLYDTADSLVLP